MKRRVILSCCSVEIIMQRLTPILPFAVKDGNVLVQSWERDAHTPGSFSTFHLI